VFTAAAKLALETSIGATAAKRQNAFIVRILATFSMLTLQPFSPLDGPVDFLAKFFDTHVYEWIMEQTNLYAKQKKIRHWQDVTTDELRAFNAILIAMGLHDEPATEMFWSSDTLFRVQPIADIMPVKRYKKIRQALHINDNSKTSKRGDEYFDKLYEIRPIVEKLNMEFMQQCVSSTSQSTGWAKKTAPNFSCNNFGKYGPILIMFSLLHPQMN